MLIVPIGDKDSRRTTPWVCILLILINTLIYAWTTHRDYQRDEPLTAEQETRLADHEASLLLQWLMHKDSNRYADAISMDSRGPDLMWSFGWYDREFAHYVQQQWQQQPPPSQWRDLRQKLDSWLADDSTMRWGLIPNEMSITTLLSSQFMHGSWFHLLGNMLFLIVFGIAMERHWGSLRFIGAYLISGIGAALLFIAKDPHSGIPLVGASGAISGLMGLFVGTYRLQRLEFFYSLGFLFGSFRAPALVLFPVWLGWELVQSATAQTNVAYMAHAGGLLTGLAIAFCLPYTRPKKAASDTHKGAARDTRRQAPVPRLSQQLAEQLRFSDAQTHCRQQLHSTPTSLPQWCFFLEMGARLQQLPGAMMESIKALREHPGSDALLGQVWKEFEELGGQTEALPAPYQLLLAELACRQKQRHKATAIVTALQASDWQHPRLKALSQKLANA
jgi:membrane associated rhomboid family serine protease